MSARAQPIRRRVRQIDWLTGPRLLVVALVVLLASVLVPRAVVHGATTVAFDWIATPGVPDSLIRAPANQQAAANAPIFRGDIASGFYQLYPAGQAGGERIGSIYYLLVGTAPSQGYEAAGNHVFGLVRLEIWEQGSLDLMGTHRFLSRGYFSVTGGTGAYAGAEGACVLDRASATASRFTCTLQ